MVLAVSMEVTAFAGVLVWGDTLLMFIVWVVLWELLLAATVMFVLGVSSAALTATVMYFHDQMELEHQLYGFHMADFVAEANGSSTGDVGAFRHWYVVETEAVGDNVL
eukprot:400133-Ditylum_brightwellii.AAC.1